MVRQEKYFKGDDFIDNGKKKKGPSKLDKKKAEQVRAAGLVPEEPVLVSGPETVEEPGIKVATIETEPKQKLEVDPIIDLPPSPATKTVKKYAHIPEEHWSQRDKDEYEDFAAKYGLNSFYKGNDGETLRIAQYYPREEIVVLDFYKDGKFKRNADFFRGEFESGIKDYTKTEKPENEQKNTWKKKFTQLDADIFETKSKTYNGKKYVNGSVPEDANEEIMKSKNLEQLAKIQEETNKKEGQAEIDPDKHAKKPLIVEDAAEKEATNGLAKKMERLEKAVELARKKYTHADFEVNSALARIRKILHLGADFTNREEIDRAYSEYKKNLNELLDSKIEELKSRNLGKDEIRKEMGDLVRYFDFDEKLNLYNNYTESRAGAIEKKFGRVPGWVANKSSALLSGYGKFSKKLGFKGKTALSLALAGTGVFAAVAVNRFLGSALVAKGVISKSETNLRERQKQASEARAQEILRQLETSEKEYDDFVNMLQQQSVGDYRGALDSERKEGWKRIGKGLAVAGATFAVSKALSHFISEGWEPAKERVGEILEKIGIHSGIVSVGDLHTPGTDETPGFPEAPTENVEKLIPLHVEEGSSLEGTLRDHLESSGMDHGEAGRQADILMRNYATGHNIPFENLNHVLPGQELDLNPDGTIKNIPGFGNLDNIPEKGLDLTEKVEINASTAGGNIEEDMASLGAAGGAVAMADIGRKRMKEKRLEQKQTGGFKLDETIKKDIDTINSKIGELGKDIDQIDEEIMKSDGSDEVMIDKLINKKQELEKIKFEAVLEWYKNYIKTINNYIQGSLSGKWDEIKKKPAQEMLKDKKSNTNKFYKYLLQLESGRLAKEKGKLNPKSGETIEAWVIRLVKSARTASIENI